MPELSKFDELRNKTENELVYLVNNELELGVHEARQACANSQAQLLSEPHYLKAKRAYAEVSRLIPLIDEVPQDRRCPWEASLTQLQEILERLSVLDLRHTAADAGRPGHLRGLAHEHVGDGAAGFRNATAVAH